VSALPWLTRDLLLAGSEVPKLMDEPQEALTAPKELLIASPASKQRRELARAARACGFAPVLAADMRAAERVLRRRRILAVVVSFPPQLDPPLVQALRPLTDVPILVLLAGETATELDVVSALDAGADECLRSAVGAEELGARLRAGLRRAVSPHSAPIRTPDFTIDLAERQVVCQGQVVALTPIEWRLLDVLVSHAGHLVSWEDLLRSIWGPGHEDRTHSLRVHLAAIRRKLEPDHSQPRYFVTFPGLGLRFQPGAAVGSPGSPGSARS